MIEISKAAIEKNGKYLLLKRAEHSKTYPGTWDFAGGKHDPEETSEQAVIRETKEETSLRINPGKEIRTRKFSNEENNFLFHYFIPEIIGGEIKISPDHSEVLWATPKEIRDLE